MQTVLYATRTEMLHGKGNLTA